VSVLGFQYCNSYTATQLLIYGVSRATDVSGWQLLSTSDEVVKLQEDLEKMKPLLAEAIHESVVTMQKISEDTV